MDKLNIFTVKLSSNFESVTEELREAEVERIDDFTGVVTLMDGTFVEREKLCLIDSHTAYIAIDGMYSSNNEIIRMREHCKQCNNGRQSSEEFERRIVFSVLRTYLFRTIKEKLQYLDEQTDCPIRATSYK